MIRFLFIFSLLSVGLFARLNPFEPVNGQAIEESTNSRPVANLNSKDDGNRTVKVVSDKKIETNKETKKTVKAEVKKEIKKEVKKANAIKTEVPKKVAETIIPTEEIVKAELPTTTKDANISKEDVKKDLKLASKQVLKQKITRVKKAKINKKMKVIKKRVSKIKKIVKNNSTPSLRYNILPLLTIDLLGKGLTISTANNYKLIRYYEERTENKFVFDFQADINVPTVKEEFNSPYYQSYIVGNHPEDAYFRVVISAKESVSNYKVMIKNNIGSIIHK
jgi:hypothetical protein